MIVQILLLCITLALILTYLTGLYNENYWKKRGVTYYKKHRLMGPVWDFITQDRAMFEVLQDLYKQYPKEPAIGVGSILTPALYVRNLENIQHVLQTDFQSFNDRALDITPDDVLADNITFMHGNRWKLVRQQMSPLFTATKLKNMYYIVDKSAKDFVQYVKDSPQNLKSENVFETLTTFCSAAIGAAVFGITSKSIFDSPFLKMARDSVAPSLLRNLKFGLMNVSTSLARLLRLTLFKEHEKFFVGAIKQVIRQRENENVKKHDFADICVSLQKNGTMRDQDTGLEMEPTDELLAAQAFFFFIAGVEPTATGMLGTFIELGRNPEILEKLHKEIDDTYAKYNGELTYDAVTEMEYLEEVISEALRMHPPIGFLSRQCVRDTVLPVGNIRVQKGTRVFTPLYDLHYDPEYYPNPQVFDPERFAQDSKGGDVSYQPFGKGGRICVGMRYARLQMKAGIVHLLREFTVKSEIVGGKLKYSKQQFQVRPANAKVEFTPRKLNCN